MPTAYTVRRVAIFYDGSFFQSFNKWCKTNLNGFINFQNLHDYVVWWISKEAESSAPPHLFRLVEAHYFQGRFSLESALREGRERGNRFPSTIGELPPETYYVTRDRLIDEILMKANITTHYYPVRQDTKQEQSKEKAIDVWLSLEAYDLAVHKRFDYFVLFSGDEDFVPLVRKINSLGITTIILGVDTEAIKTSKRLIEEASYHLYLDRKLVGIKSSPKAFGPEEAQKLEKIIYSQGVLS